MTYCYCNSMSYNILVGQKGTTWNNSVTEYSVVDYQKVYVEKESQNYDEKNENRMYSGS